MSDCPHCGVSYDLIGAARSCTVGVLTARRNNNINDANMLISEYLQQATDNDIPITSAWAMLFSAATMLVDAMLDCRAVHHDEEPLEALRQMALAMAAHR